MHDLEHYINKLGVTALAQKYEVTESTVYKWKRGLHKPSLQTLDKSSKKLL